MPVVRGGPAHSLAWRVQPSVGWAGAQPHPQAWDGPGVCGSNADALSHCLSGTIQEQRDGRSWNPVGRGACAHLTLPSSHHLTCRQRCHSPMPSFIHSSIHHPFDRPRLAAPSCAGSLQETPTVAEDHGSSGHPGGEARGGGGAGDQPGGLHPRAEGAAGSRQAPPALHLRMLICEMAGRSVFLSWGYWEEQMSFSIKTLSTLTAVYKQVNSKDRLCSAGNYTQDCNDL